MMIRTARLSLFACAVLFLACSSPGEQSPDQGTGNADLGDTGSGEGPCAPLAAPSADATCPVSIRYIPTRAIKSVAIAGEWNGWSTSAQTLTGPDGSGAYTLNLQLPPGVHGYKLVEDGTSWQLDAGNPYRKYVGGTENSGLRVANCFRVGLSVKPGSLQITRSASEQGELTATILVHSPSGAAQPGLCQLRSMIRRPDSDPLASLPQLSSLELKIAEDRQSATVHLRNLTDGKYQITLTASAGGQDGDPLLLPFWIEPEPFRWSDTPLYMAMTDRFVDGDGKNPGALPAVVPAANFRGGDLQGVTQLIELGYFDQLGVRALWLSPFYSQPSTAHPDQSGKYNVTAYHGYWPVRPRSVDDRIGGDEALQRLVQAAHRHGIRVLMDAVLNHVHDQHEYFQDPQKRSWFRTGCICGSPGCDWTDKRLSCLFASYMPDIDWTQTEASEQFISDTLWWLEHFNLDGLRVDAVKHVEDAAIFNLTARIRERFEQAGTRYYLLGETAMGWREGDITTNQSEYDTIKRYMGPNGLDGQFDFVWYHANSYRVFAYDEKRFLHLDYWTHASLDQFRGSTMVNYLGSHDTSRFLSMATYRDPTPGSAGDRNIANNKWDKLPQQPSDDEPYDRQWLGTLSVFTMPGMPLLYYGDEYGEFGGGDPDNRHMMRLGGQLATREKNQLSRMQKLLTARQKLRGLRRDKLVTALLGEDVYAFARPDDDPKHGALVILNRLSYQTTASVPIPSELGWATAVTVKDQLSDKTYTVPAAGGRLAVTVPARGGVVLARE